ncbi:hypothetical protein OB2597_13358 [Pseudooceanicola batsensis HTCC2597]|uniref:Uncharacterized protein n=1 Tax=Pseudooceanicola batsensis (strain ATCC BAA-863 / DSM 15984 / KCTC 12145 / HTCC2597) TaxID=252305 RepID=A3TYA0_PSEBH|nr:hypothetical protein [Pseudooceanicola batsensis]EAQ03134.1 hypothetical protein OB2597_13358 [Pseudooceanicola batsensis HTCC2597]
MLMQDDQIDELKGLFMKARQRPVNFGLSLGKKPENTVMMLDLKKPPATLMRNAKKAGETPKVTCGTCEINGKEMVLTCEADVPPGIAKSMKKFFTNMNQKFKVIVLDANGGTVEAEEDAEDDGPEAQAPDAGTPAEEQQAGNDAVGDADDPLAGRWTQIEGALSPVIQRFAAADQAKGPAVAKAWSGAQAAAAKGDYKGALAVAAKLKQVVDAGASGQAQQEQPAAAPSDDPDAAKWTAIADNLAALYMKAIATNPANRTQLEGAYMMAVEKAEQHDYKTAVTIAGKLTPALQKAAAEGSGTEQEVPKDVVPFQKSRILWQSTRSSMFSEIGKLQDAIRAQIAETPELAAISGEINGLTDRLADFDTQLEKVLDQITVTPDGRDRELLKKQALDAVRRYQAALQDDFFGDVDQNNGFVNVSVTAPATKSLESIAKVLVA